jgi:type II secretory pathway component GspD/PulD (secretin)
MRWTGYALLSALLTSSALVGCSSSEPARETKAPAEKRAEAPVAPAPRNAAGPEAGGGGGGAAGGYEEIMRKLEDEAKLSEQERVALAEGYSRSGQKSFQELNFEKARDEFQRAVDLAPGNAEYRKWLDRTRQQLSEHVPGYDRAVMEALTDRLLARKEQARIEIQDHLARGNRAVTDKEFQLAIDEYTAVIEQIQWFPYHLDLEAVKGEAEVGLRRARDLKAEADRARSLETVRNAKAESDVKRTEERARRAEAIGKLFNEAQEEFERERFGISEALCDKVLQLDPNNDDAADLKEIAVMARHKQADKRILESLKREWKWQFIKIDEKTVAQNRVVEFPDAEIWVDEVQKRIPRGIQKQEKKVSESERKTYAAMSSIKISLNFTDTPLPEVVSFMQEVTQLNIMIDRRAIEDPESKTVTFKVDELAFDQALDLILKMADLAYRVDEGVIVITSKEAMQKETVLELYDVQDLTIKITNFKAPEISLESAGAADSGGIGVGTTGGEEEGTAIPGEDLKLLISQNIAPGTWDTPPNSIEYQNGILIVRHTSQTQGQINAFLNRVRESTGLLVTIESRFLTVQEHFLEDVGVDYRGLESTNNFEPGSRGPIPVLDDFTIPPTPTPAGYFEGSAGPTAGSPIGPESGFYGLFGPENSRELRGIVEHLVGGNELVNFFYNNIFSNTGGLGLVFTLVDDTSLEAILRATRKDEKSRVLTAPKLTVYNTQRANVFVASQIAYIRDYDIEIAQDAAIPDPVVGTFQDGIALDVRPTISADRKYITLELRPTVAEQVQDITDSFVDIFPDPTRRAITVPVRIETPILRIQRVKTTVTVPDGGTLLVGGLTNIFDSSFNSELPIASDIPIVSFFTSRKADVMQHKSLLIIIRAKITIMEEEEEDRFGRRVNR